MGDKKNINILHFKKCRSHVTLGNFLKIVNEMKGHNTSVFFFSGQGRHCAKDADHAHKEGGQPVVRCGDH